jgi:hypothetical protein
VSSWVRGLLLLDLLQLPEHNVAGGVSGNTLLNGDALYFIELLASRWLLHVSSVLCPATSPQRMTALETVAFTCNLFEAMLSNTLVQWCSAGEVCGPAD